MEIEGKVIQSLATQSGESNGKTWVKGGFVIETFGQYPTTIAFEVFGEEKVNDIPNIIGQTIKVSFDIKSREYNGKWYHSITAYKVDLAGQPSQPQYNGLLRQPITQQVAPIAQPVQQVQQPVQQEVQTEVEVLPF